MNIQNFLKEQATIEETRASRTSKLVSAWEKTKLLEGLGKKDAHELSQLLQTQANRLLVEATRTGTSAGSEEWTGIALPMVRKIFVEQLAKQLVHTQSMDRPSGLVFYLDYEIDEDRPADAPIYSSGESVYGITDQSDDPTGGFYGGDKFSYTMNYYSASVAVASTGSVTWKDVDFDPNLSASVAAGDLKYIQFTTSSGWKADYTALESFVVTGSANIEALYRQYTSLEGGNGLRFIYSGSAIDLATDLALRYTEQPVDYDRGDFEMGQSGVGAIPQMNLKITSKDVIAKTRKLKTVITPEAIQDMNAYQSIDAQKELTDLVSKYVEQEEDTEILNLLARAARPITRYWSALPGRYLNSRTGEIDNSQPTYTLGQMDWFKHLGIRIRDISNEIHRRTLRGGANWIVCSPKVATILEAFNTFRTVQDNEFNYGMGTEKFGQVDGRINIFKNPYYSENEILLGFKGNGFAESGAAYCQYIPLMLTPPLTDPDDYTIKQGLMTRNAKVVLRSEFYARIIVRDIDSV